MNTRKCQVAHSNNRRLNQHQWHWTIEMFAAKVGRGTPDKNYGKTVHQAGWQAVLDFASHK